MKVRELMVGEVQTCFAGDDLARAAQLMWENDCGALPVVEADNYVVGMITDRDVCMAAYTQGSSLHGIRVGDVMSRQVTALRPEEDASAISRAMRSQRVRRLPVVNALGRIVGIVSLSDLARRANPSKGTNSRDLTLEAVAETFAAVTRPWAAPADVPPALPESPPAPTSALLRPQRAR